MWPHLAGQVPAAHVPCPSRGAQCFSARRSAFTHPLPLAAADLFPGGGAPSSHDKGRLGNGILEAALPLGPDVNTTRHALPRDPSLFQVTKIHQRPVVATLDVDSSAQDTRETKGQQEPAAMEEPKAHSGKEEL